MEWNFTEQTRQMPRAQAPPAPEAPQQPQQAAPRQPAPRQPRPQLQAPPPEQNIPAANWQQVMPLRDFTDFITVGVQTFGRCNRLLFCISKIPNRKYHLYYESWHVYGLLREVPTDRQNSLFFYLGTIVLQHEIRQSRLWFVKIWYPKQEQLFPQNIDRRLYNDISAQEIQAVRDMNENMNWGLDRNRETNDILQGLWRVRQQGLTRPSVLSWQREEFGKGHLQGII